MIIIPSRGRPHLLQRFFDKGQPTLPGMVVLDDDDYEKYNDVQYPHNWICLVLPRTHISEKCNAVLDRFPGLPFYGISNDDVVPETECWDIDLLEAAGKFNFAYGDDGINHRYSTAIHSGDLIRAVGWILCPAVKHFYTDDAWEIFKEIGLGVYLPDVKVTHMHFTNGKAEFDQTYAQRGSPAQDKLRFEEWKQNEWPDLKLKVSNYAK